MDFEGVVSSETQHGGVIHGEGVCCASTRAGTNLLIASRRRLGDAKDEQAVIFAAVCKEPVSGGKGSNGPGEEKSRPMTVVVLQQFAIDVDGVEVAIIDRKCSQWAVENRFGRVASLGDPGDEFEDASSSTLKVQCCSIEVHHRRLSEVGCEEL